MSDDIIVRCAAAVTSEDIDDVEMMTLISDCAMEILNQRKLIKMGRAVVDDFMPGIKHCALQDYGRLNNFLAATQWS